MKTDRKNFIFSLYWAQLFDMKTTFNKKLQASFFMALYKARAPGQLPWLPPPLDGPAKVSFAPAHLSPIYCSDSLITSP